MKTIGIDTSTMRGSVAYLKSSTIVDEIASAEATSFSRSLLGMLEKLLARNEVDISDIDRFGVAVGPGSFTGIRIGIATIAGIAQSLERPVIGVSTLEAIAKAADIEKEPKAIPLLNAGRGNFYSAIFNISQNIDRLSEDRLGSAEETLGGEMENALFVVNSAETFGDSVLPKRFTDSMKMSIAAGVAQIAEKNDEKQGILPLLKPNYIHRGPVPA